MNNLKIYIAFVIAVIIIAAFGIGGWALERWINWKMYYGNQVNPRIEQLEKRIEALEKKSANAGIETPTNGVRR